MSETAKNLEAEGDIAADFLEGLLDIADLDGDIDMDVDGDRAAVEIVGGNLEHLVGRDGEVLDALQELTRRGGRCDRKGEERGVICCVRCDDAVRAQSRARCGGGWRPAQFL